jgi:hypothetical protein
MDGLITLTRGSTPQISLGKRGCDYLINETGPSQSCLVLYITYQELSGTWTRNLIAEQRSDQVR